MSWRVDNMGCKVDDDETIDTGMRTREEIEKEIKEIRRENSGCSENLKANGYDKYIEALKWVLNEEGDK